MNNRERNWYEKEHGEHPPICNCVDCCRKRELAKLETETIIQEQARMRTGAEERIAQIKARANEP